MIRGERKHEAELKEESYYRLETAYGTFERIILLPEGFEEAEIEAAYEDGVLEVIVPAAARALEAPEAGGRSRSRRPCRPRPRRSPRRIGGSAPRPPFLEGRPRDAKSRGLHA